MNRVNRLALVLALSRGLLFAQPSEPTFSKRGFDDLSPISLDVDGDGRLDLITPRIVRRQVHHPNLQSSESRRPEAHFIVFDLKFANGRFLKSFFKFKFGDSKADYWVYSMALPGKPTSGSPELLFYSGDDTSDVTIHLRLQNGRFRVVSTRRTQED